MLLLSKREIQNPAPGMTAQSLAIGMIRRDGNITDVDDFHAANSARCGVTRKNTIRMIPRMSERQNNLLLITAAALLFALIALFHLASAKAGHSHYRDQHLGTAIEFAKSGIDLLGPVVVGFTATGTPTPLEVPFWQSLAALMFRSFGFWFGWANLLSLALFSAGLWPLHSLVRTYLGSRGAWWTLIFLMAQPILILISGQASADGLAFTFSLWFLFFAHNLVRTGAAVWLGPAAIFGALAAVTKLPLFMCAGLASFFFLLLLAPRDGRRWLLLASAGAISGIAFLLWTRHTNSCLAAAEFPHVDLRVIYGNDQWFWYFGDWHYRLNPANWAKGGWAALNALFGSFALAGLAGWALFSPRHRFAHLWLLAAFCTTLVFSHLVLVHRHYFILYSPAIAILCAGTILQLEERLGLRGAGRQALATLGTLLVILLAAVQGLIGIEIVLGYDPYPKKVATIIREHTSPEDKLLIQGGGWGGEALILSQRRGLTITSTGILENEETRQRLLELGYTKLVMISESPLLNALQQTNPGNASRERASYRASLTPVAEPFKTKFESPDVIVKDLPVRTP